MWTSWILKRSSTPPFITTKHFAKKKNSPPSLKRKTQIIKKLFKSSTKKITPKRTSRVFLVCFFGLLYMSFSRSFRPRSEQTNDGTNDGNVATALLGTDLRGVPREWRRPAFSEFFFVRGEDATKNTHNKWEGVCFWNLLFGVVVFFKKKEVETLFFWSCVCYVFVFFWGLKMGFVLCKNKVISLANPKSFGPTSFEFYLNLQFSTQQCFQLNLILKNVEDWGT